ncbi:MAG: 50S ribosomal protein L11 methyltransferase [Desulfobacterales bacterium]|nr:50S ribosomal protein L11 methyltransferase [Desulfobacterales bacterium]
MDSRAAIEAGSFLGHWQEEESSLPVFLGARGRAEVEDDPPPTAASAPASTAPACPTISGRGRSSPAEPHRPVSLRRPPGRRPAPADGRVTTGSCHPAGPGAGLRGRQSSHHPRLLAGAGAGGGQRPAETVLDLGTGTGILALAAAKLLDARVLAVDLNSAGRPDRRAQRPAEPAQPTASWWPRARAEDAIGLPGGSRGRQPPRRGDAAHDGRPGLPAETAFHPLRPAAQRRQGSPAPAVACWACASSRSGCGTASGTPTTRDRCCQTTEPRPLEPDWTVIYGCSHRTRGQSILAPRPRRPLP